MFEPVDDHPRRARRRDGAARPASDGPLLDLGSVLESIWRYKLLIVLTTIIGAVLGVMIALSTPHDYYAEARIYIDPRDIRTEENEPGSQLLPTEAMLALVDSQMQIVTSTAVLQAVIDDLDLIDDAELNGSLEESGLDAVISAVTGFFGDEEDDELSNRVVLDNLRDAVSVSRDSQTFIVTVSAETLDPDKSAAIANSVVENYLLLEDDARSGLLARTSTAFTGQIEDLRSDLDRAERAVEQFKADNGIIGASGQVVGETQLLGLSERLTDARTERVRAEARADAVRNVAVGDVLTGAIPQDISSDTLTGLRTEYANLKAQADSLATRLGPRHPQMIAAQSSLTAARQEVANELRRIVGSAQTELERASEIEEQLAAQLAVLQSQQLNTNVESVELRQLEREAEATRQIYEDFLLRARRASERQNVSVANVRIVSEAEPPIDPSGSSRKIVAIAGTLLGFLVGVGIAVLAAIVGSFSSSERRRDDASEDDWQPTPVHRTPEPRHQPQPAFAPARPAEMDDPVSHAHSEPAAVDPRSPRQVQTPPPEPAFSDTPLRPSIGERPLVDGTTPDRPLVAASSEPERDRSFGAQSDMPAPGEPGYLDAEEAELRQLRERMRRLRQRADAYSRMGFEN